MPYISRVELADILEKICEPAARITELEAERDAAKAEAEMWVREVTGRDSDIERLEAENAELKATEQAAYELSMRTTTELTELRAENERLKADNMKYLNTIYAIKLDNHSIKVELATCRASTILADDYEQVMSDNEALRTENEHLKTKLAVRERQAEIIEQDICPEDAECDLFNDDLGCGKCLATHALAQARAELEQEAKP